MKAQLVDLTFTMSGRQRLTLEFAQGEDFRSDFDALKEKNVRVEIKQYRKKRSLSANAYFHVLANKIAENQNLGNDEVKKMLVVEYGALEKNSDGTTLGFKLPDCADVDKLYPYTKVFDVREENGRMFNCYLVYKRTRDHDSKEMARLIDGTVYEAQALGIETATPEELAKMKGLLDDESTEAGTEAREG